MAGPGDRRLVRLLLILMQKRGDHSAGMAAIDPEGGQMMLAKEAMSATEFVHTPAWREAMEAPGTLLIGHTRYATHGARTAANAHPFAEGDRIVGAHNGVIDNHKEFDEAAEVDSQALFRALARNEGHPNDVLDKVKGYYALTWYDHREKAVFLAKGGYSPIYVCRDKVGGALYWASEKDAIELAAHTFLEDFQIGEFKDGDAWKVDAVTGKVTDGFSVTIPKRGSTVTYNTSGGGRGPHGGQTFLQEGDDEWEGYGYPGYGGYGGFVRDEGRGRLPGPAGGTVEAAAPKMAQEDAAPQAESPSVVAEAAAELAAEDAAKAGHDAMPGFRPGPDHPWWDMGWDWDVCYMCQECRWVDVDGVCPACCAASGWTPTLPGHEPKRTKWSEVKMGDPPDYAFM